MTTMGGSCLMAFLGCGAPPWGMLIHVLVQRSPNNMKPWTIAQLFRWQVRLLLVWPLALPKWHQPA